MAFLQNRGLAHETGALLTDNHSRSQPVIRSCGTYLRGLSWEAPKKPKIENGYLTPIPEVVHLFRSEYSFVCVMAVRWYLTGSWRVSYMKGNGHICNSSNFIILFQLLFRNFECWNLYHMMEGDHRDCSAFFLGNQHTTTIRGFDILDNLFRVDKRSHVSVSGEARYSKGRFVVIGGATHCRYRALKWKVAMMLTLSSLMVPQVVIKFTCDTINNDKVVTMPTFHPIKKIR